MRNWMARAFAATALACTLIAITGATRTAAEATVAAPLPFDLSTARSAALDSLMANFGTDSGEAWSTNWWTTATTLDTVIEYEKNTGDRRYVADVAAIYDTDVEQGGFAGHDFVNDYTDDSLWWGVAWLHAYQLTGDRRYLATAQHVADYAATMWTPSCAGGVEWANGNVPGGQQKNAVTNELYGQLNAELYNVTRVRAYHDRAVQEWNWFARSGMIQSNDMIIDHLDADCRATSGALSYTQGVVLAELVALRTATGVDAVLTRNAVMLADASTTDPRLNPHGVLRDLCTPECVRDSGSFQGMYFLDLGRLNDALPGHPYTSYLNRQAATMYDHDRAVGDEYGDLLAGPVHVATVWTQASAVALLVAAR